MVAAESTRVPVVERHLTDPFRVWVCRCGVDGIGAEEIPARDDPLWRDPGMGATYENDCERGKRTTRDVQRMPTEAARLLAWLRSTAMLEYWATQTSIAGLIDDATLHGGGLHVLAGGGWLNTHLDYARHPLMVGYERRVNLLLFLNRHWRDEWGGAFEVCRPDGTVVERIYPAPGRLVVFETSDMSYHGTERTNGAAPDRVTLAAYYLAPARPGATRMRALFLPTREPR